ncbi:hypothetical protein GCM10010294_25260 [Streptomyces griseoloalbus]|uniref:hypothetical protein n=1 Tax=Streptomyces griseoloalbus TaxID=67303 RepID=UPI001876F8CB|nr:hypothetical protein GCM10010294_25260 [Streptomyces griseoloalbus]
MTLTLAVLLALAAGGSIGYRMRPAPRRTWACARCDEAAIRAETARYNAVLLALDFDTPDDPRKDQTL